MRDENTPSRHRFLAAVALTVSVLLSAAYDWAAPGRNEDGDASGTADNLIHNGDFEIVSSDCPPSGWTMWGAQKYKIPANYTRDETAAHGGKASFRIYHPTNTSGYVVSAPERAIRPRTARSTRYRPTPVRTGTARPCSA
jgi:hypothetical protein